MIDGLEDIIDKETLTRLEEDISRTGQVTAIKELDFKCTCFACPEQYDVYHDGHYIAYVRERHGHLTVNPVTNGEINWDELIYEEHEGEQGYCFEKRAEKLVLIANEIKKFYRRQHKMSEQLKKSLKRALADVKHGRITEYASVDEMCKDLGI